MKEEKCPFCRENTTYDYSRGKDNPLCEKCGMEIIKLELIEEEMESLLKGKQIGLFEDEGRKIYIQLSYSKS